MKADIWNWRNFSMIPVEVVRGQPSGLLQHLRSLFNVVHRALQNSSSSEVLAAYPNGAVCIFRQWHRPEPSLL